MILLFDRPLAEQRKDPWDTQSMQRFKSMCESIGLDPDTMSIRYDGQGLPSDDLLVCMGDEVCRKYAGVSCHTHRGFPGKEHNGHRTFCLLDPRYLGNQPRMYVPFNRDLHKLKGYVEGTWPLPRPNWTHLQNFSTYHAAQIIDRPIKHVVIDTEYDNEDDTIYPGKLTLTGLLIWDGESIHGWQFPVYKGYEHECWVNTIRELQAKHVMVYHNLMADIPVLQEVGCLSYDAHHQVEDTMLMHALLDCEQPHKLEFLESLYSPYEKMKHLMSENPLLYNWGDCLTTHHAYMALRKEMDKDPESETIYRTQSLPLSPIRMKAKRRGIHIDPQFVVDKFTEMRRRAEAAKRVAMAYVGRPFNLGSRQQVIQLLSREGVAWKRSKKKGKKTANLTLDKDNLAELRARYRQPVPEEERDGMTPDQLCQHIKEGGHPLLECLRAYNAAADVISDFLMNFIRPEHKKQVKGGVTPQLSWVVERVHPTQHIHTQASGRWSTVKPALPLLPPKLRKVMIPGPGRALIKFDWDQIELRLGSAMANDRPSLEAFEKKWDIHTINACDVFGYEYPPDPRDPHKDPANQAWRDKYQWEGKDDARRKFVKGFVYRLRYRGNPKLAGDIPGAKERGLDGPALIKAARNYLKKRPMLQAYWDKLDRQILKTRKVRSAYGRLRFLYGSAQGSVISVPEICREGTNHPLQATVSDIYNLTVIEIAEKGEHIDLSWCYGAHDSQMWEVPEEHEEEAIRIIQRVAAQTRVINGIPVELPIEIDPPVRRKAIC